MCQTPCYDNNDGGYLAIAVLSSADNQNVLAVARGGGDGGWKPLRSPAGGDGEGYYYSFSCSDAVAHKGRVFAVDGSGSVYAWEVVDTEQEADAPAPVMIEPPNVDDLVEDGEFECGWRLAESDDGRRLLLVCVYGRQVEMYAVRGYDRREVAYVGYANEGVRLYERDADFDGGRWSAVDGLGGNNELSLFLGINYPFTAPIVEQEPWTWRPQLRPNCVYVTDNRLWWSQCAENGMEGFDLGDEGRQRWSYRLYSDSFDNFQIPMWFRPLLKNYDQLEH